MTTKSLYRLVSRQRLTRADYDAMRDRANYSTLKAFAKSALHYRHALASAARNGRPRGSPRSLAVLADRYAAGSRCGRRQARPRVEGVRRGQLHAPPGPRSTIASVGRRRCAATRRALRIAARARSGTPGRTQSRGSSAGRGRLDREGRRVFDPRPRDACERSRGSRGTRLPRAGRSRRRVNAATGERLPSLIVAVESEAPFAVQVYDVGAEIRRRATPTVVAQLRVPRDEQGRATRPACGAAGAEVGTRRASSGRRARRGSGAGARIMSDTGTTESTQNGRRRPTVEIVGRCEGARPLTKYFALDECRR